MLFSKKKQPYRQFNKANYEDIRYWFITINWEEELKNLGVISQNDLKFNKQYVKAVITANRHDKQINTVTINWW